MRNTSPFENVFSVRFVICLPVYFRRMFPGVMTRCNAFSPTCLSPLTVNCLCSRLICSTHPQRTATPASGALRLMFDNDHRHGAQDDTTEFWLTPSSSASSTPHTSSIPSSNTGEHLLHCRSDRSEIVIAPPQPLPSRLS